MILALLLALALQSADRLPPANPLPPPASEEAQVLAPVERLFAALAAKDAAATLALVRPEGRATGVERKPDGTTVIAGTSWAEFAGGLAAPGPRYDERLVGTPAVEIDGDLAMVWSAYTLTADGKFAHCGTDHIDLVRENGAWKVLNLTWTKRTTGCDAR